MKNAITSVLSGIRAFLTELWTAFLKSIEIGIVAYLDGTAITFIGALCFMIENVLGDENDN